MSVYGTGSGYVIATLPRVDIFSCDLCTSKLAFSESQSRDSRLIMSHVLPLSTDCHTWADLGGTIGENIETKINE